MMTSAVLMLFPQTATSQPDEPKETESSPAHHIQLGDQGGMDIHGLLQIQLAGTFNDHDPYARLGATKTGIRLRRAEVQLTGSYSPNIDFRLMFDVSKVREFGAITTTDANGAPLSIPLPASPISILQDFSLTFKHIPAMSLSLGQQLVPISLEGLWPAGNLLLAERSDVGSIFGDKRDIGVWAHYRFQSFAYVVGLYQGAGPNRADADDKKDLRIRFELTPLQGLLLAAAGHRTLASSGVGVTSLIAANARVELGRLVAQSEVAWQRRNSGAGDVESFGGYVTVAYWISAETRPLQGAARFDWFDANGDISGDDYWRATVGATYTGVPWARFQLNYVHSAGGLGGSIDNDLVIFLTQTNF